MKFFSHSEIPSNTRAKKKNRRMNSPRTRFFFHRRRYFRDNTLTSNKESEKKNVAMPIPKWRKNFVFEDTNFVLANRKIIDAKKIPIRNGAKRKFRDTNQLITIKILNGKILFFSATKGRRYSSNKWIKTLITTFCAYFKLLRVEKPYLSNIQKRGVFSRETILYLKVRIRSRHLL